VIGDGVSSQTIADWLIEHAKKNPMRSCRVDKGSAGRTCQEGKKDELQTCQVDPSRQGYKGIREINQSFHCTFDLLPPGIALTLTKLKGYRSKETHDNSGWT
jgi:hypothetical protein